jgi:hypothetical protein
MISREGRPSPRRVGVNSPSVNWRAWPEKAADLERILQENNGRYGLTKGHRLLRPRD